MGRLIKFLKRHGIEPKDMSLYRKAFTHVTCADTSGDSYERLEFLGDCVVGMIIGDFLYRKFPEKEEGELTKMRAAVVSRESLAAVSEAMGIGELIRAGTMRFKEDGRVESSILGDVFESLVGAIFADRGYMAAKRFVLSVLKDACLSIKNSEGPMDYKSRLQEIWQEKYKEPPVYKVISEKGPDHNKIFMVEVRYKKRILGRGEGSSKKKAEQEAARMALQNLSES